jgi:hypothetical protein
LKSPSFNINVRQGAGGDVSANSGFSQSDVKLLNEDIRFIKTSNFNLEYKKEISLIKSWFWYLIVLPLLAFVGTFVIKRRQEKISLNVLLLKYQKAEKAARKRLKSAKAALDKNDTSNFYSELSLALFGYLEDKLGIQKAEFTLEGAVENLLHRNVKEELINRVKRIAEKCEYVRFAPQGETTETAIEIYNETVNVIIEVDSSLERRK